MVKLLTKCKEVDRDSVNKRGLTATDILQRQSLLGCSEENLKLLNRAPWRFCKMLRLKIKGKFDAYIKDLTPETINALLVVFTLVLTMTYQAILSPQCRCRCS
ncbi:hypothetical protein V6N13_113522 [Hibiscus sabdariffa]|uniref:Uncharacterized protein n=1 Tax=Hibiscus sabdariffa TaxID=183260 RepID=A0ABR2CUW1_9ROSI